MLNGSVGQLALLDVVDELHHSVIHRVGKPTFLPYSDTALLIESTSVGSSLDMTVGGIFLHIGVSACKVKF